MRKPERIKRHFIPGLGGAAPKTKAFFRRRRRRMKAPKEKRNSEYVRLWNIVDGAVADALNKHPEYLRSGKIASAVRVSINKRVVGALMGFRKEESKRQKVAAG